MDWNPEEENRIRRYLLDDATQDERRRVEVRLLEDDDYGEWLLLIEDELIDDYARGALPARESGLFARNFLVTPQRRQGLAVAREMTKCAAAKDTATVDSMKQQIDVAAESHTTDETETAHQVLISEVRRGRGWWRVLFVPNWKIAGYALLVLGVGLAVWQWRLSGSDVKKGLSALNQAYGERRPLEARITGFVYAPFPFSTQRGNVEEQKIDQVALDRAKHFLLGRSVDDHDPALLHALGKYYLTQKDFDTAIAQFQKVLNLGVESAQLHSDWGAALIGKTGHIDTADPDRRTKDINECFTHLNRAMELDPGLLEALFNRALLNQREQLRREARADWEKYLRQDPKSFWAEEAQQNLKEVEEDLRKGSLRSEQLYQDFRSAFQAYNNERALKAFSLGFSLNGNYIIGQLIDGFLAAQLAGRKNEAEENMRALSYIGKLAREKTGDRYTDDLAHYYQQARPDQLALSASARGLMAEANGFYRKSENDRAIELYEKARQMFARAGNTGEEIFAEAWIGHCHHQRSDTEPNLRIFMRLTPICAERKYRWMQANALCGRANAHNSSGRFSQAITDCLQCGKIAGELGDYMGVLRSRYILGGFYYELGRHEENLRLSESAQKLADQLSADIRYSMPFYNIRAWSLSALGFREAAFAFQREAVKMAEDTKSSRLRAYAYIFQGMIFAQHKKFAEAIISARRGIAIGREMGSDRTGQDFVHTGLLQLGHIYRAAGRFPEAITAFNQVMGFYRGSKKEAYLYGAAKGRLLTLIAQRDDAAARDELREVLALYEKYRKSIQEESNRNSFFDQEQSVYDIAIDFAYARLGDPEQALTFAELNRARSLRDANERGWEMIDGLEAPELLLKASPEPNGASEIQRQMPDDVQLIEYAVLEDKLIVWIISKTIINNRVLSISFTELNERVNRYLALVNQAPGRTDQRWIETAMELHDALVLPVEPLIDRRKQICVIPDKILTRLSFGALVARASGRLLIEDYLLSYASSANVFLDLTEKARQKDGAVQERLLAVGNPRFDRRAFPKLDDLRSAEEEAAGVSTYYQSPRLLTKDGATKSAVLREMQHVDVTHFALHYVPDVWSPMFSRILLAAGRGDEHDGSLHMHELYRLALVQLRLVVLSACQARGEEVHAGEGAIGVTRPFEAAGVPLVVASLWSVDSDATSDLMVSFHRTRKQFGRSTAEALRIAQLEMAGGGGKYRHPYYWAAFVVIGGYSKY